MVLILINKTLRLIKFIIFCNLNTRQISSSQPVVILNHMQFHFLRTKRQVRRPIHLHQGRPQNWPSAFFFARYQPFILLIYHLTFNSLTLFKIPEFQQPMNFRLVIALGHWNHSYFTHLQPNILIEERTFKDCVAAPIRIVQVVYLEWNLINNLH